ncbi:ArnT family glycosyltransferase [Larkinella punicea]|uniref:Glycosyltransferase family 39 protein n=1 Tax=Larkinella punicea TaxID=2315727 RepID=A0A368JLV3_9BACT|nr:glycosyltransferase family 39 protein [Larkinella punicea]RCR68046.1 glycosyltransferase family 39 protein [Larkinella punicea]
MPRIPSRFIPVLLVLAGALFYFPFLGRVHLFDWDEINFAESAREMIVTGNYTRVQINFQPFWEKPPLFFWLQVLAMKAFGINEFAARFPNAVMGIVTLLVLYFVGKKSVDERFGLLWALAYFGSLTPHLYFKSGIIDPTFNLFIFLSVWLIAQAVSAYGTSKATRLAAFSGLFVGLAVLTKGPVGGLLVGLTFLIYWAIQRFRPILSFLNGLLFFGCGLAVASVWFGLELVKNGFWFFEEFFRYQIRLFSTPDAGHQQPFYYHFVVVLLGCFPMSLLAIRGFFSGARPDFNGPAFRRWMIILFWVVMILFSIVKTKIVHYSSMAWFPVSYLAATVLYQYLNGALKWNRWLTIGIAVIGGVLALLITALPLVGMNAADLIPYIKDRFAAANLTAPVEWQGWEWIIGTVYGLIILGLLVLRQKRPVGSVVTLFLATPVLLWFVLPAIVPKIERYTQGAVIDFYEAKQGQDVYIEPIGYKSYAHLFYFRKQPPTNPNSYREDWLINGLVDKPAFFVTRNINIDQYRYHPNLEIIREEAGFVFLRRKPAFK